MIMMQFPAFTYRFESDPWNESAKHLTTSMLSSVANVSGLPSTFKSYANTEAKGNGMLTAIDNRKYQYIVCTPDT